MSSLILKKDKNIYLKRWIYGDKKKEGEYENTIIDKKFILSFLDISIEIEENFTLRDWFEIVLNYDLLQKLDLYFPSFIKEYKSCPVEKCCDDIISSITISRIIELPENHNEEIELYIDVGGYSKKEDHSYSLSFNPLSNLLDLPIILKKCLICYTPEKSVEYENIYTLGEFIKSVIWEISFYGEPKERDKEFEKVKDIMSDITDGLVRSRIKVKEKDLK